MSTIRVKRPHALGEEEALRRARDLVEQFGGKLNASIDWSGPDASFKGRGFTGSARVDGDSVSVDVELGLLLRPLRGQIESKLEEALRDRFA